MAYTLEQITEAQRKVQELQSKISTPYTSTYQSKIDSLLNDINNRKPFSYDFNADPLYQQYRQRYQDQGKMAMLDTQAASAALTGGYGNSYGATAGSLAYQNYLKGLNDVIPSLQNSAYTKYTAEGQDMYNRLGAYQDAENAAYQKYRDTLSDYYNQLNYWAGIAAANAAAGGGGGGGGGTPKLNTLSSVLQVAANDYNNGKLGYDFQKGKVTGSNLGSLVNAYSGSMNKDSVKSAVGWTVRNAALKTAEGRAASDAAALAKSKARQAALMRAQGK